MDEYTQICNKLAELLAYQNQIREMSEEIAQITVTPPEIDEDSDTISWEEAVKHSESKKQHFEKLETLKVGLSNREEMIKMKKKEIGSMLPIEDKFILFKVTLQGTEQSFRVGYFSDIDELKIERV